MVSLSRMYGMVRPMANSPPNRLRYGRPTTSRSAPRSLRLVHDGGTHVASLEQHGLEDHLRVLGDLLGGMSSSTLDLLASAGDVGIERQRPVGLSTTWTATSRLLTVGPLLRRGGRSSHHSVLRSRRRPPDGRRGYGHQTCPETIPPARERGPMTPEIDGARARRPRPVSRSRLRLRECRRERPRTVPDPRGGTARSRRPYAAARAGRS